jgi:recombinational DNA repair protein (RecF pathway)
MPRCYRCEKSVDPYDLKEVEGDLFCSSCRELRPEPARAEEPKKEVTMSKDRKAIASIACRPWSRT